MVHHLPGKRQARILPRLAQQHQRPNAAGELATLTRQIGVEHHGGFSGLPRMIVS